MKNKILNMVFIFLIIAVLVWLGFYLAGNKSLSEETNVENNQVAQEDSFQEDSIDPQLFDNYIRANIAELSPEPAVLGGTFYVTELSMINDNLALVSYEDGHIALRAMVGFNVVNEQVIIESFEIMPEEPVDNPIVQENEYENSICLNQCGNGICEEMVCMGEGCPCPETSQSCPTDCF
jgi:hypothetical protein